MVGPASFSRPPDGRGDLRLGERIALALEGGDRRWLEALLVEAERDFPGIKLDITNKTFAKLNYASVELRWLRFIDCTFEHVTFASVHEVSFVGCHIADSTFSSLKGSGSGRRTRQRDDASRGAHVENSVFHDCEVSRTTFDRTGLRFLLLSKSTFENVKFHACTIDGPINVERSVNSEQIQGWETCLVRTDPSDISIEFGVDSALSRRRFLSWQDIRWLSSLPVLHVSYFVTALLFLYFSLAGEIRDFTTHLTNGLCGRVEKVIDILGPNTRIEALSDVRNWCVQTKHVVDLLFLPGWQYGLLLLSTISLMIAASLFAVFCPSRLKEYSLDAWQFQLRRSLTEYVPYFYKRPAAALVTKLLFILSLGGLVYLAGVRLSHYVVLLVGR